MIRRGTCQCEIPHAYCRKIKKVDVWFCIKCAGSVPKNRVTVQLHNFHPIDWEAKAKRKQDEKSKLHDARRGT